MTDQTKFRLSEISKLENYFHEEINQRKTSNKNLSKYVTVFDCIDKILNVLGATSVNRNDQKISKHSKKQKEKARQNSYVA